MSAYNEKRQLSILLVYYFASFMVLNQIDRLAAPKRLFINEVSSMFLESNSTCSSAIFA